MKENKAAILPSSKMSTFFNHSSSMDTKDPINLASAGNHYIYVIVDHFSNYNVTVPIPKNIQNALNSFNHHWISNLVLLNIWLQIEELNVSTLKWQIAVVCSVFVTLREPHMLLGQMDLLKYKNKILEPIWCFYLILLKTGLFKCFSLLMLILLTHYHVFIFHHME